MTTQIVALYGISQLAFGFAAGCAVAWMILNYRSWRTRRP